MKTLAPLLLAIALSLPAEANTRARKAPRPATPVPAAQAAPPVESTASFGSFSKSFQFGAHLGMLVRSKDTPFLGGIDVERRFSMLYGATLLTELSLNPFTPAFGAGVTLRPLEEEPTFRISFVPAMRLPKGGTSVFFTRFGILYEMPLSGTWTISPLFALDFATANQNGFLI
jgi:hypothetical protein